MMPTNYKVREIVIREMTIDDYDVLINLFHSVPGITVREADSKKSVEKYLIRNEGLNFVAINNSTIVGCVMCGHDGRRGYLQHLVVTPDCRLKGIGSSLFNRCIQALKQKGIDKTHIFVFKPNELANEFWRNQGWKLRDEINMYSFNSSSNENI